MNIQSPFSMRIDGAEGGSRPSILLGSEEIWTSKKVYPSYSEARDAAEAKFTRTLKALFAGD